MKLNHVLASHGGLQKAVCACGFALLLASSSAGLWAQEPPGGSVHQRPTDVRIVMSTSRGKYDGE